MDRVARLPPTTKKWLQERKLTTLTIFRCDGCRRIVRDDEAFNCPSCLNRDLADMRLCGTCGPRLHAGHKKPELATLKIDEADEIEESREISNEPRAESGPCQAELDSSVTPSSGMADRANRMDSNGCFRCVFKFFSGGVLNELDKEYAELEKRRLQYENKQSQIRSIVRKFESDVNKFETDVKNVLTGAGSDETVRTNSGPNESYNNRRGTIRRSNFAGNERRRIPQDVSVAPNERQVFVGGLPTGVNEEDLKNLFSNYGNVTDVALLPRTPRKSACAFVAFDSVEAVQAALRDPPEYSPHWSNSPDRRLYVEAKCSTSMTSLPDDVKIRVTNLPVGCRLIQVKEFFETYGKVEGVKLRYRRTERGHRDCYAYVAFELAETARNVAEDRVLYFGSSHRAIYVKTIGRV